MAGRENSLYDWSEPRLLDGVFSDRFSRSGSSGTESGMAVALVLERTDLLPHGNTMPEAIECIGPEWCKAALRVQRNRK